MKRQVAVIGLGRFGYGVAETLVKKGCEVLAIDTDPEKVQVISDLATFAVQCDATDEKALRAISIQNVDVAVVSIGENVEASILIVQTLKELGIKQNPQEPGRLGGHLSGARCRHSSCTAADVAECL